MIYRQRISRGGEGVSGGWLISPASYEPLSLECRSPVHGSAVKSSSVATFDSMVLDG